MEEDVFLFRRLTPSKSRQVRSASVVAKIRVGTDSGWFRANRNTIGFF
jgi:hypothetical protein